MERKLKSGKTKMTEKYDLEKIKNKDKIILDLCGGTGSWYFAEDVL